jgi:hypothetical protein
VSLGRKQLINGVESFNSFVEYEPHMPFSQKTLWKMIMRVGWYVREGSLLKACIFDGFFLSKGSL